MEAICSSETSTEFQRTTRRHIPDDNTLHNHRCENLKSYEENLIYQDLFLSLIMKSMRQRKPGKAMADFKGGGHTNITFKSNTEFVQEQNDMHKILV
jgi:hypothetical protein